MESCFKQITRNIQYRTCRKGLKFNKYSTLTHPFSHFHIFTLSYYHIFILTYASPYQTF